ncbi:MAG TPA: YciI family protein [Gemmatimonadaceae bacterium]|nr:YciI family protein [Gemmatimonadaceae bacterium]
MKYLAIYRSPETGTPPSTELMTQMGNLIQEMTDKGILLSTEGCLPSAKGARVRLSKGKITVTDGPFTETKEVVGGFAIFEVKSKDEAIEWTKRFIKVAGDGECEVRQIATENDFGDQFTPELREQEDRSRAKLAERAKQR